MGNEARFAEGYHINTNICLWYRDTIGAQNEKMKKDPSIKCDCWCHKDRISTYYMIKAISDYI